MEHLEIFQDIQTEALDTNDSKYMDPRFWLPRRHMVRGLGTLRPGRCDWFLFDSAGRERPQPEGIPLRRRIFNTLRRDRRLLRENLLHRSKNSLQKQKTRRGYQRRHHWNQSRGKRRAKKTISHKTFSFRTREINKIYFPFSSFYSKMHKIR